MKNRLSFRLSKELEQKLKEKASNESVGYSTIIVLALEAYLTK